MKWLKCHLTWSGRLVYPLSPTQMYSMALVILEREWVIYAFSSHPPLWTPALLGSSCPPPCDPPHASHQLSARHSSFSWSSEPSLIWNIHVCHQLHYRDCERSLDPSSTTIWNLILRGHPLNSLQGPTCCWVAWSSFSFLLISPL